MKTLGCTIFFLTVSPVFAVSLSPGLLSFAPFDAPYLRDLAPPLDAVPNANVVPPYVSVPAMSYGLPVTNPITAAPPTTPVSVAPAAPPVILAHAIAPDVVTMRLGFSIESNEYGPCFSDALCNQSFSFFLINPSSIGCAGCVTSPAPGSTGIPAPVGAPEPLPWALAGLGLVGLALLRRRRSRT
ncbi:MAG: hypothetical protein JO138_26650 [Acidobacteriaceae bacterium]|nr:hypothetical protein [Acidobacteriaceae bacterium]